MSTQQGSPMTNRRGTGAVDNMNTSSKSRSKKRGEGRWTRVSRACERCRRSKLRCDDKRPCYNCKRCPHLCVPDRESLNVNKTSTNPNGASPTDSEGMKSLINNITFSETSNTSSDQGDFGTSSIECDQDQRSARVGNVYGPDFSVTPLFNEISEKRWAGESCYAAFAMLSPLQPFFRSPDARRGLPGTDEQPTDNDFRVPDTFVDPSSCGFPDRETSFLFLEHFLDSVHCIFTFVHAKLERIYFDQLFSHGVFDTRQDAQAAHLAILALGWHSSITEPPSTSEGEARPKAQRRDGEEMYRQARQLTFSSLAKPCSLSLTSLIALTLYQQATRRFEDAWATFGICVRQAQSIALHRETPGWKMSPSLREGRRKIWLNIFTLDTFLSICYGRPPAISEQHCDIYLHIPCDDDFKTIPESESTWAPAQASLLQLCISSPSRWQFHLLKLHLCLVARNILTSFYLRPSGSSSPLSDREKWNRLQSIMEDLHELGACIPDHLKVAQVDVQEDAAYRQQAVWLDMLINYVIILANRPLVYRGGEADRLGNHDVADSVSAARQKACRDSMYAAGCGICSVLVDGRESILSPTIHLILSAWGVYTSAAELVALHAMSTSVDSPEAQQAYRYLSCILQHFARLRKIWPSVTQEYTMLHDLIGRVRTKIREESRLVSAGLIEQVNHPQAPSASPIDDLELLGQHSAFRNMDRQGPDQETIHTEGNQEAAMLEGIDFRWFDEFLENSGAEPTAQHTRLWEQPGMSEYEDLVSFCASSQSASTFEFL